jgi:NTE family protein
MNKFILGAMAAIVSPLLFPAFGKTAARPTPNPSIGLALGSGGAAGLAHIAMLQTFDNLKIKPARIVGTSIGAVIGTLYAAGLSAAEIQEIFDEFGGSTLDALSGLIRSHGVLNFNTFFKAGDGALVDPANFINFLAERIEARSFSDLLIPMEIIATDYFTGETVVLKEGNVLTAIEASMAVPGLFPPVSYEERLLIDGGTSNPLPFDILKNKCDFIVAIDVTGSRSRETVEKEVHILDIIFDTFEIMQKSIIFTLLRNFQPEIYIKPDIKKIRLLEFNRIEEVMEQSIPAADELRVKLLKKISEHQE